MAVCDIGHVFCPPPARVGLTVDSVALYPPCAA
ncbi:hypothetical protein OK074_6624 [Actinobacteria bacterium OK074]|nr:hypothetical protein OK074_6624 [Actinobacteria bacterium OK074]